MGQGSLEAKHCALVLVLVVGIGVAVELVVIVEEVVGIGEVVIEEVVVLLLLSQPIIDIVLRGVGVV